MVISSGYYMFRRMMRSYISMSILLLLPIGLITVLNLIADNTVNDAVGLPVKDEVAITMMFGFLMFGGFITMEFIRDDLMSSMRWRMYSLPFQAHKHAYSVLISSTIFNVLQSSIIVIYTTFVTGVYWGNPGIVLLTIVTVTVVVQFAYINFVLAVNHYKSAERLGMAFGLGNIMLAQVWFPMPDGAFFQFVSAYCIPLSLGQNMLFASITGNNTGMAVISFFILAGTAIVLALSAAFLGRRKFL
ncbi:ABC transporter [Alkalicoccus daliensis]|uniref:ABC-2 type transport system permease protein n=1 Tax=Alkalicoccus daliensis TaxID=745820 RepID=A0A1H0F7E9_9BACI|nr:ABC transporter [Alkalicoccus daliensis]SDN90553.1 ABC-2 type transport system permease protein [Alkalicoccus daliensis]